MKYFDAFSGIGGFDEAIKHVIPGAVNVGYSEIDKYAIKVYEKHNPNAINFGDIRRIEPRELPDFDILTSGSPCQDFSIAGKRTGLEGARSGLIYEVFRIIREKQPRIVFLENVAGILSSNQGWDFAEILCQMDDAGYDCEWELINTKRYLPQNRQRIYIIGHYRRESWKPVFPIKPEPNEIQEKTNTGLSKCISNGGGQGAKTGLYVISDSGVNRKSQLRIENIAPLRANTGAGHNNKIVQQKSIRRLTPTECERLQGYPDGFTAIGSDGKAISDTQRYRMLGNAVSVPVIAAIIQKMVETGAIR